MKKLSFITCLIILISLFVSCGNIPNETDEISIDDLQGTYKNNVLDDPLAEEEYLQVTVKNTEISVEYIVLSSVPLLNTLRNVSISFKDILINEDIKQISFSSKLTYQKDSFLHEAGTSTSTLYSFEFSDDVISLLKSDDDVSPSQIQKRQSFIKINDFDVNFSDLFDAKQKSDEYMIGLKNKQDNVDMIDYARSFSVDDVSGNYYFYYNINPYSGVNHRRSGYVTVENEDDLFTINGFTYK